MPRCTVDDFMEVVFGCVDIGRCGTIGKQRLGLSCELRPLGQLYSSYFNLNVRATEHRHPLDNTKLYCLVSEA